MNWTDVASEGLPAPRDDEPASLRRDILDELSDHLTCATRRESGRFPEEETARRAALERFGDPRRVAWRLWLDANKETIMNQRITLAAMSVLTAAVVLLCALTWLMFQQGREVNAAILAKLETLAAGPEQEADSLEWTELTVRCVNETEDGPPAVGFKVLLQGKIFNASELAIASGTTDAQGIAHFGPIRPGGYQVSVDAPWGIRSSRGVSLFPGSERTETFVCPEGPRDTVDVELAVDWPADLKEKGLGLALVFSRVWPGLTTYADSWSFENGTAGYEAVLAEGGRLLDPATYSSGGGGGPGLLGDIVFGNEELRVEPSLRVIEGPYLMKIRAVYRTIHRPELPSKRLLSPIVRSFRDSVGVYKFGERPRFEASVGGENRWTIKLPDPLLEEIRERLAQADRLPEGS